MLGFHHTLFDSTYMYVPGTQPGTLWDPICGDTVCVDSSVRTNNTKAMGANHRGHHTTENVYVLSK